MVGSNLLDMVILKVDVSNIQLFKLYRDQRNTTAVYTYNNIPSITNRSVLYIFTINENPN